MIMGSGAETARETVAFLAARGERLAWHRCGFTGRSRPMR